MAMLSSSLDTVKSRSSPNATSRESLNDLRNASSTTHREIRAALQDRIICQRGKSSMDLTLCQLAEVPMDYIEAALLGQTMRSLELAFNRLRYLPSNFALSFISLTKLDLSRNELKRLPDNFGKLIQLVFLDVHSNQLQTLPLSMGRMSRLECLNIDDNPLQAPLCNLLSFDSPATPTNNARVIVKFLSALYRESIPTQKYDFSVIRDPPPNSVSVDESASEDLEQMASEQEKTYVETIQHFILRWPNAFFLFLFLIPVVLALLFDGKFIDNATRHHDWVSPVWDAYKPIHTFASRWLKYCGVDRRYFYVTEVEDEGNFFQRFYRKLV